MPTAIESDDKGLMFRQENNDVLLLTTSLLIDRMFLYSSFLERLTNDANVSIWAESYQSSKYKRIWDAKRAEISQFPATGPSFELFNFFRRINESAWDYRLNPVSRISFLRHRWRQRRLLIKISRLIGITLAILKKERLLEGLVERALISDNRSAVAMERLKDDRPDLILVTGPFQFQQPAVVAYAKKLNIPTLCLIPSWDNLSTKNRMVFEYDGYLVWSEASKKQLNYFYPNTREKPVYVVGAPQFDVFFQDEFFQSRDEFCLQEKLDPGLPIIVYALGSPNFLQEHHGALQFAELISNGDLGRVQLLVRPHPIFDNAELSRLFANYGPSISVQKVYDPTDSSKRSQDESQITQWVNTFRHADVVINLSSTVSIDAAIFDTPIVNLDFDPQPGQADQMLIKDINHLWTHFKPIAESGGVWLVNDFDQLVDAVKQYLKDPGLHKEQRRWIAEYVCGYLDGRCGERMAEAIIDFTDRLKHRRARTNPV